MSRFSMSLRKRKAANTQSDNLDSHDHHVAFENPTIKRMHFTSISDSGAQQIGGVAGRIPIHLDPLPILPQDSEPAPAPSDKQRTQNGQLLDDYEDIFEVLGDLLVEHEADPDIDAGSMCSCGSEKVKIQCHDCTGYKATCTKCFIVQHLNNPFHWAEKWDAVEGFFVKHDISSLGHIIHCQEFSVFELIGRHEGSKVTEDK
ncbi:hypothetical protein B0H13DRAFT_1880363 [Mycena leptocephala]|nr:hypothetical protein B0H13DRAFT_1880363 [Mycena leptocephala]